MKEKTQELTILSHSDVSVLSNPKDKYPDEQNCENLNTANRRDGMSDHVSPDLSGSHKNFRRL
jgi:hypothetical protein